MTRYPAVMPALTDQLSSLIPAWKILTVALLQFASPARRILLGLAPAAVTQHQAAGQNAVVLGQTGPWFACWFVYSHRFAAREARVIERNADLGPLGERCLCVAVQWCQKLDAEHFPFRVQRVTPVTMPIGEWYLANRNFHRACDETNFVEEYCRIHAISALKLVGCSKQSKRGTDKGNLIGKWPSDVSWGI